MHTVLTLFGTRPELIKLAPVLQTLQGCSELKSIAVCSGQHRELLSPLFDLFSIQVDHDLDVMRPSQTPNEVCARVLTSLDPILAEESPDVVLVQGDTTTALAGAMTAFHRRILIGHVEAGLRTNEKTNPWPEEMNRRLITRLADFHFASTERNQEALLKENVPEKDVFLTGNPVVDALHSILKNSSISPDLQRLLEQTEGTRRIILTTHRRESHGDVLTQNLLTLKAFVEAHDDVALIFPVHPNPQVRETTYTLLDQKPRIYLLPPLPYGDFIPLLARAWLIVSDSGGIQEEAPTLQKPLLILRETTERPEAIECGCAQIVGSDSQKLAHLLELAYQSPEQNPHNPDITNPFGQGDSAKRIVQSLLTVLKDRGPT